MSFAALALALSLAGPIAAQDCPRGDLDKLFCDVDGDMIADTPTDPAQQVDPDTLIFAYTPVEDPAVYKTAWSDFITHLEKETGKSVVFFQVQKQRRSDRGHAIWSPAYRGFQYWIKPISCKLRRLQTVYDHGGCRWWLWL